MCPYQESSRVSAMFSIVAISAVLILYPLTSHCHPASLEESDDEVKAQGIGVSGNSMSISTEVFDLLMGRYGRSSLQGGSIYTRWGRTSCPTDKKTELLYSGRVGGTYYNHPGGGANYLCLPSVPKYLGNLYAKGSQISWLYGAEYQYTHVGHHDWNVPCAVCYAPRSAKVMIPADIECPKSFTMEYRGYLMAEHYSFKQNVVYECVDENAETIPGSARDTNGVLFYHVISSCGAGMPCGPYIKNKVIPCVVCTK